jgi:hypothetical protein
MSPAPNLLTLLDWADRLAAGESCADWERWLSSSPGAQEHWQCVLAAHNRLAAGEATAEDSPIGAELVAAFALGNLDAAEREAIEADCLRSPALLDEVASTDWFEREASAQPISAALETRLLALAPPARLAVNIPAQPADNTAAQPTGNALVRRNGHRTKLPVAKPLPPEPPPPVAPALLIRSGRAPARRNMTVTLSAWQIAAAAGLVAVSLCAAALWLANRNESQSKSPVIVKDVTKHDDQPPPEPRPAPPQDAPAHETTPPLPPPDSRPPPSDRPQPTPESDLPEPRNSPPDSRPKSESAPKPMPRPGPPPELAISSARGLMLVNSGAGGAWQVGQGKLAGQDEVRIASLPESWTSVEIPRFGTSIWSGAASATLVANDDRSLTIRLQHGKFALQGLPAGTEIRIETPAGECLARAIDDYSTLAVVGDDLSPALYVPLGAVSVNDAHVAQDQLVRWQNGAPLPPEPLAAGPSAGATANAAAENPFDPAWLAPPSATEQKEWRTTFGKVVERLQGSDDVAAELDKLLTPTTHGRQAALLAIWRIELMEDAGEQARTTWELLADRRELVRVAAFRYLLELPAHDQRAANLTRLARRELGADLAQRLANWLNTARQGQTPTLMEARELTEHLGNSELVVRQAAASLLVHHTRSAFQQLRREPPDFDATAPATRRAAAQQEWRQAVRQIFGRANGPAAIRPAVP